MKNQLFPSFATGICICASLFFAAPKSQAQPVITNQPADTTATVGTTPLISVGATGTGTLNYRWWFSGTNFVVGYASQLYIPNVQTSDAGNYFVIVTDDFGSVTSRVATLTVIPKTLPPPTQPSITSEPTNLTVDANSAAIFNVTATGSTPLSYFWFFNDTSDPVGNSATLTLNNVQTNQSGNYFVIVTNSIGSVTSSVVTLTVNPVFVPPPTTPSITNQPASVVTNSGAYAYFNVRADGTMPLTYRWWFSGTNVPVGFASTLNLSHVTTNQSGNYFVVVTNSAGSVTSDIATLTAYTVPATNSPGLWLISHSETNGDVLKLVLDLGKNYRIESSPNMVNWFDVTNFFSVISPMYYTNGMATNSALYYRLVSP